MWGKGRQRHGSWFGRTCASGVVDRAAAYCYSITSSLPRHDRWNHGYDAWQWWPVSASHDRNRHACRGVYTFPPRYTLCIWMQWMPVQACAGRRGKDPLAPTEPCPSCGPWIPHMQEAQTLASRRAPLRVVDSVGDSPSSPGDSSLPLGQANYRNRPSRPSPLAQRRPISAGPFSSDEITSGSSQPRAGHEIARPHCGRPRPKAASRREPRAGETDAFRALPSSCERPIPAGGCLSYPLPSTYYGY